jgi:hypothetical protein
MSGKYGLFRNSKSIAGIALIGFGVLMLGGNLSDVAARLSRLVGVGAGAVQTFGELLAVGLGASQVWRSYLFDRRELVLDVCRILLSFWPLVMVIVGTVLTGMGSRMTPKNIQNKNAGPVDLTTLRSTRQ